MMLIPAADRPYVASTADNSWFSLIFGYNGLSRLTGAGPNNPSAGLTRLWTGFIGGQVGWLLPFAFAGLLAGLWVTRRTARENRRRAAYVLFGLWGLAGFVVFSFSQGIFLPYYTAAMAPSVAAVAGGGAILMFDRCRVGWGWMSALAAAVAATAAVSFLLLRYTPSYLPWLRWAVLGAAGVAVLGFVAWRACARRLRPWPGRRLRQPNAGRLVPTGNHVDLTDRATQCLSSLSVDFERFEPGHPRGSPDMQVQSVSIDGAPASFRFAEPTYPGDPRGPDDADPRAHEASQHDPVGGPDHNSLPPARSPELTGQAVVHHHAYRGSNSYFDSQDGSRCPANKLVITPKAPIPDGQTFTITVNYTGTPRVHYDGDGSTEGWLRTSDGSWMATEPIGSEDWMPLNDYPTAKPTYDFSITTERGKTAIANGQRVSVTNNSPDAEFPNGSTTTVWRAPMGIGSYLALTIVGDYTAKVHTVDGVRYYAFQSRSIPARLRARNAAVIAMQPAITRFEQQFAGRLPFASDGIVVGSPRTASRTEEIESMIVWPAGHVNGTSLLVHENFHQWWGDNVSEGNFEMAFSKDGLAVLSQQLDRAHGWAQRAGGLNTTAGRAAFEQSLVRAFNSLYAIGRRLLEACTVEPFTGHLSRCLRRLSAARGRLHRAAPDPRAARLRRRPACDPAQVRGLVDHRAPARGGVHRATAQPHRSLPEAPVAVLQPVVRYRLPRLQTADHRPGTARALVLRPRLRGHRRASLTDLARRRRPRGGSDPGHRRAVVAGVAE
ncbi:MAG: hypothetical protein ACRDMX_08215 [Solirubrobacteraceae bacterium]